MRKRRPRPTRHGLHGHVLRYASQDRNHQMRVMSTASDGDGRRENVKTMSRKPAAKQYFRVCHLEASREGWTGLQAADNADTSSAPCLTSPSHGLVSVRRHAGLSARRRMRDCVHDAASIYSRMQAMHAFSVRWLALAGAFGLHGIDDRMPAGIGESLISSVSPGSKQRVSGGIASFVPPFPATSPCGVPPMQCLPDGVWAHGYEGIAGSGMSAAHDSAGWACKSMYADKDTVCPDR